MEIRDFNKEYMDFIKGILPMIDSVKLPMITNIDGKWEGGEAILGVTGDVSVYVEKVAEYSRSIKYNVKFLDFTTEIQLYCPPTKAPSDVVMEYKGKVMHSVHSKLFEEEMFDYINEENDKARAEIGRQIGEAIKNGDFKLEKSWRDD